MKELIRRLCLVFLMPCLLAALTGCGSLVLSQQTNYAAEMDQILSELEAAKNGAMAAGAAHDARAFEAARNQALQACAPVDRYVSYGEAAVRSFYGQMVSRHVDHEFARQRYERLCVVDGGSRLYEEVAIQQNMATVLRDACGCPFGEDAEFNADAPVSLGQCTLSDEVWDDFWENSDNAMATISSASFIAIGSGGLAIPFLIGGLGEAFNERLNDRRDFCRSGFRTLGRQKQKVAAVKEECGEPPDIIVHRPETLTAEWLDHTINDVLGDARATGEGGDDDDGSWLYSRAYLAQQACREFADLYGDDGAGVVAAEIDTHADLEPSAFGDYEPPAYEPPPETPAPQLPGGG